MASTVWRLHIPNGTLEGLKWLALVSMIYDHVVRLLFMGPVLGSATAFGRLAFPLFAFILAYNLARPGVDARVYRRLILRLVGFGFLALPASLYLVGVQQFNILLPLPCSSRCSGFSACGRCGLRCRLRSSCSYRLGHK